MKRKLMSSCLIFLLLVSISVIGMGTTSTAQAESKSQTDSQQVAFGEYWEFFNSQDLEDFYSWLNDMIMIWTHKELT